MRIQDAHPDIQALQSRISSNVLAYTVHGSSLYGFQTEKSDRDFFAITDSNWNKARHSVVQLDDGVQSDIVHMGMDRFLQNVNAGSHQSLEALFSTELVFLDGVMPYKAMLQHMRVQSPAVFNAYKRTIKTFSFGEFKQRRHAVRLTGNLHDLRHYGIFNPRMTMREAAAASSLAENLAGHALKGILLNQF